MTISNITIPFKHGNLSVPVTPRDGVLNNVLIKSSSTAYDMEWGRSVKMSKEVRIDANIVTKGASAPSSTTRAIGASGGILIPVISFSKITQQDVHFIFHVPSDIYATDPIHFHLMWQAGAAWTAGHYIWKLEYLIKEEHGATLLADDPTTISSGNVTPDNATTNIETEYADNITVAAEQLLYCHFYRDVADTADDVGEVTFFEIEYTAWCLGA